MELVVGKVLAIFLLMAAGFGVGRLKVLPEGSNATLNVLLIKVITPCMILSSITSKELTDDTLSMTLQTFAGSVVFFVIAGVLGYFFAKHLLRVSPSSNLGVYTFAFASINTGFMGFPVTLALFGQDIFYLMVMQNVILTVYLYSAGPLMLRLGCEDGEVLPAGAADTVGAVETAGTSDTANAAKMPATAGSGSALKSFFMSFWNPNAVASVISLIMLFAGLHLPKLIFEPVQTLGDATIPLSMLLVGIQLSESNVAELIKNGKILAFSLGKMLLLPVLTFFAVNWLPLAVSVKVCLIFAAVFPVAVVVEPVTAMENKNSLTAAELIAITTLLSVGTIPLFATLLTQFYLS